MIRPPLKRSALAAPPAASVLGAMPFAPRMTATLSGRAPGFPSTKNGEWPYYTADVRGSRYSPLDQINGTNFNQLEVAWRFKTDNLGTRPEFKLRSEERRVGKEWRAWGWRCEAAKERR